MNFDENTSKPLCLIVAALCGDLGPDNQESIRLCKK
jgi:hypothetical protein